VTTRLKYINVDLNHTLYPTPGSFLLCTAVNGCYGGCMWIQSYTSECHCALLC